MGKEVFPWLKYIPLAPEYHPTVAEFQDPIAYIFKIEEEASKYGICKIVPPISALPRKTVISNLNQSLSHRSPYSSPTFTTRVQQIGFCSRQRQPPVQKSVRESGETYTLPQFEAKAKKFERNYLKKRSNSKTGLSELEVETLYWKVQMEKPFTIEYANDMPESAFHQTKGGDGETVGETWWNMGVVSKAQGSLLRFIKEEILGVTSPMVYLGMLFSWFAWHVEDHDLHSLNYMHMGAGKTWYGIPSDVAVAFEDVVRTYGYGGKINPLVTFATLAEKTTIMSPEVFLKARVPCCRLVQNVGEFVVTFPRAYHSGFSHGFNCAEAVNIATPGWLRFAQDAAIRRTSINWPPLVSHCQLLYDFALSLSSSAPTSIAHEPQSSRLKDKLKVEGETLIKRRFLQDMVKNNELLHVLGESLPIVLQPMKTKTDAGIFSCVTCGVLCYPCVAIIQPTEAAARYIMSTNSIDVREDANVIDPKSSLGKKLKITCECLFDVPIKSIDEMQGHISITSCPRTYKYNSSLGLLALAHGDSLDSGDEDDVEKYIHVDYSSDRFPGNRRNINDQVNYVVQSKSDKLLMESYCSMRMNRACDEDSSRVHVFCLQHAIEVEQRLRSIGGVHMLLICHQDYLKLDAEARLVTEELGTNHIWNDFGFRKANRDNSEMIQSALAIAETTHDNRDWAVKLGMNIYYSASLSRSPLYGKQMPYNSVIYNAFDHSSLLSDPSKPNPSDKEENVFVVGKWCGKVWMSNRVHPLLLAHNLEEEEGTDVSIFSRFNVRRETYSQTKYVTTENVKKRKRNVLKRGQTLLKTGTKRVKKTFACDLEGCDMSFESKKELEFHKSNVCRENGCGMKFFCHRHLLRHRRAHTNERPLHCPWKGCDMSFTWEWARTKHIRLHMVALPYVWVKDRRG